MKKKLTAAMLALLLAAGGAASAAEKWEMAPIGKMTLPAKVRMEKGEQQALPFGADGPRWAFTKESMLDGAYWTLTYDDAPNFSYGWAASATLGAQYLQKAGVSGYKGKSIEEQLDLIAASLNDRFISEGAVYTGAAPLARVSDKKHPRWEGDFILVRKEKDITYRESVHAVLQLAGVRVSLGLIVNDADAPELSAAIAKMLAKRTFYSDKELLGSFLRK